MKNILVFTSLGLLAAILTWYTNYPTNLLVLISSISISIISIIANLYLYKANKKIVYGFAAAGITLYILEIIGANTGIIYGDFVYNPSWQPALLGTPVIMAIVWVTLIIESYSLSSIFNKKINRIIVSAFFLVMIDIVIDPGAIHLGLWNWVNGGSWYGVPMSNYLGWFILGIIGSGIFAFKNNHKKINIPPVLYIYTLVFWTSYNMLFKIYLPAVAGILLICLILIILNKDRFNEINDIL